MNQVKPLLAGEAILGEVTYPKLLSPKYNGVRGLCINGVMMARSLMPIPNRHTQKLFSDPAFHGLDGELVVGPWGAPNVFVESQSGVGTMEGTPDVRLYVFDVFDLPKLEFQHRVERASQRILDLGNDRIIHVPHTLVHNDEEADAAMKKYVALGLEGVVLRDPRGRYKYGRSTENEGLLLRLTPWYTSEALVIGVVEGKTNKNKAEVSELGYTKRSSHKENMIPTGTGGALKVKDLKTGNVFGMAIPLAAQADYFWSIRDRLAELKIIVSYRFKAPVKIMPRFPQYLGIRNSFDMSEA